MNNESINDEMIAGYILDDLPDEQTERLDELAVSDAEFFERMGAVENDLVDRYVRGGLNEADAARFEVHYVKSPQRRKKIQLARAFLEFAEGKTKLQGVTAESKAESMGWMTGFFASPVFRFAMAAAALVVVALAGMLVLRNFSGSGVEVASNIANQGVPDNNTSPRPDVVEVPVNTDPLLTPTPLPSPTATPSTTTPSQPLIASFVLAAPLRGGNVQSLSIPAATDKAALRLELESDDFHSYSVELKEAASGRVIWQNRRLSAVGPQSSRSIRISIPAKTLRPTIYTVSVSGKTEGGQTETVGDYPFRVVR